MSKTLWLDNIQKKRIFFALNKSECIQLLWMVGYSFRIYLKLWFWTVFVYNTKCRFFFHINNQFSNSPDNQLCVLYFSSFLTLPGVSIRLHRCKDSVPQDYPHFRGQSQVLGTTSVWLGYKIGNLPVLPTHFSFSNLLEWLTENQENAYLLSLVYYKDYKGATRWRGEVQKGPEHRSFCSCEVGVSALLAHRCVHQPEALWLPWYRDFYGGSFT